MNLTSVTFLFRVLENHESAFRIITLLFMAVKGLTEVSLYIVVN